MKTEKQCPNCNGKEFREGTDFMPIKEKNHHSADRIRFILFA